MITLSGRHQKPARSKVNIRETPITRQALGLCESINTHCSCTRQHYPDHAQACSNNVVDAALDYWSCSGLLSGLFPQTQARSSLTESSISNHLLACSILQSNCRHPSDAPHVRCRYEDDCASLPCALCDTRAKRSSSVLREMTNLLRSRGRTDDQNRLVR